MKKQYQLFAFIFLLLSNAGNSFGQLVGGTVFLQGHWLEIGQIGNGAFGACAGSIPAGYHPYCPTCAYGNGLAEVFDYGHDGWSVGSPPQMGDYTFPGTPFEGWELQIGGVRNQAFQGNFTAACPGTFGGGGGTLTGSNVSYSNSGGRILGNWQGTASGGNLEILQETRVDTEASWVVVTTRFYNKSASVIPSVYYLRTCDPDNDQQWPGGSFYTNNQVDYQNDVDHRVLVEATGRSGTYTRWGLGTKDCRAVAFVYNAWPLSSGVDLSTIWNKTYGTASYAVGVNDPGDIGFGLVYNIGNIAPFDSAVISYGYIFGAMTRTTLIDSAFPDPELSVNGVVVTTFPDTFDACAFPKLDSVPLNLLFSDDKCWTWSHWTWSPGVGLSATTGTSIFADLTAIPGAVTYTITGVDSAAYMYSCNMRTFVFTIKSCHSAWNNNPCYGDTIRLGMHGDSTGATYYWRGPAGFTSTLHDPKIAPAVFADSGMYYVIKTIAGVNDTDSTYVTVYPKPVLAITSNGPLCAGMVDTLLLSVLPVSPGETFSWTGPNGFASALPNPSIPGFIAVNAGIYTLIGTSAMGCKDTNTVNVAIVPPPPPPPITGIPVYCYGAPFLPLSVTGSNILWYYPTSTSTPTKTPPTVNTKVPGTYTFWATQTYGCISPQDSFTVVVKPEILPGFTWNTILGCASDVVTFTNTSTQAQWYTWQFDEGPGSADTTPPAHTFTEHRVHTVTLTAFTPGCSDSVVGLVNTSHSVKALFNMDTIVCAGVLTTYNDSNTTFVNSSYATEPLTVGGVPSIGNLTGTAGTTLTGIDTVPLVSYQWSFGDGSTDNVNTPHPHMYNHGGIYSVHLTVTDSVGCTDSVSHTVYALEYAVKLTHDTMLCISQPLPLLNYPYILPTTNYPPGFNDFQHDFTYSWTPSNNLSDTTLQVPYYSGVGLTTYTFTATENRYKCYVQDTMRIHSVQGVKLSHVTADATIAYGAAIQLNADSEIYYLWKPDDGSLSNANINDPIATPHKSTLYTVLGYDKNGCLDSAYVNVTVDSTMTEDIPSGFTPNGDGLNDVFRPVGIKFQNLVEFRVYNRWGQQVFYSNNPKVGWDGTFNGVPQDIDVYYYVIIVARPGGDGNNIMYKGEVTLIR